MYTKHRNQAATGAPLLSIVRSVCLFAVWYWFSAGFDSDILFHIAIWKRQGLGDTWQHSNPYTLVHYQLLAWWELFFRGLYLGMSEEYCTTVVLGFVDVSNLRVLTNEYMSTCFSTIHNRNFCKDLVCSISFISSMDVKSRIWGLELSLEVKRWRQGTNLSGMLERVANHISRYISKVLSHPFPIFHCRSSGSFLQRGLCLL